MKYTILIFLLSVVIIVCVIKTLQIRESYAPDYQDMISVPTSAYSTISDDDISYQKRYFLEFNDRFFHNAMIDALTSQKQDYSSWKPITTYDADTVKFRVSEHIQGILNREMQGTDPNLFHVVKFDIKEVLASPDGMEYVVKASELIHRNQKLYGVSLETVTLHNKKTFDTVLLKYELLGFVFEDKIDDVMPANYNQASELAYEDINKTNIIKDSDYEKRVKCKYFSDLKKYRGLVVNDENSCS